MARSGQIMYVYSHVEDLRNHPDAVADPDVLDFVGHELDYLDRNYPPRGLASSPPPPYEPISYPPSSPSPHPAFPVHPPTTATIADAQGPRPVPPHLLNDRAFSPFPRDNPHFIMTANEHIRAAPAPPPRESAFLRQIPPSLQPGHAPLYHSSTQHRRSQSIPYPPSNPPVPPKEYLPPPPLQSGPTPPLMSQRMISASSMFPHHAVWRPPVSYASSAESGSSTSSHSSSLQHTPGASPFSSTDSSPRNSSAPTTPSASSANLLREDHPSSVPPLPAPTEAPVTVPVPPARVAPPPRTSSFGLPRPPTAQAPVSLPGTDANLPPATTARPPQPSHNQSAPELHVRPPPPPMLARSATAPARPPPTPAASHTQLTNRSHSQSQPRDQQQRGRSREQQPGQAVTRQRSRRPSITAPRDLDRIDELDETDPRGLAWHHESPYELATRTLSHRKADGQEVDGHGAGNATSRGSAERPRPKKKPSTTFSVEPGQIFPSGALYQAMQPPYRPQAPTAASQPPAFDPYSQEQLAYAPGAPSLPPTTPAPTETGKLRKTPSRSQPVSQLTTPGAHQQQPGPFRNHPGPPPQPAPVGQLPERPTDAMPPQFHVSGPIRPMLQQRPSQRSHVRFESPSRPEVRPPLKQGSVDEAYDGMEMPGPPPLPVAHNAPPPQQPPPPPQEDKSPPLPQKPQSRPGSMYMTSSRNGSALPRPDIPLPPRRPVPSVQTPLPPRHLPKQLVMPAPLQPLEDQRKAEVARLAQQHRAQAIPQERRSEEGPVRYPDIHTHDGRYMLHHSMSHRQSPVAQVPERATVTRAASQGQNRAQSVHSSAGPNVLRKRSVNSASTPLVGPDAAASNTTAAMFAARVVDDSPKGKTVERVASGVWARDRVREEEIQRELAREQKVERKLSKLTRRLR